MNIQDSQNTDLEIDEFYFHLQKDGNGIKPVLIDSSTNPFPGFRPFQTSEYLFFFGREGQADVLIKQLRDFPFLAVIGSSGTGKSSLVRAGLIPNLYSGFLREAGDEWDIAICRPGNNPIRNLAISLTITQNPEDNLTDIKSKYPEMESRLKQDSFGLLNFMPKSESDDGNASRLLIIVDQFEEIFRFKREGSSDDANHFVKLLLNATQLSKKSVYVVITMRSEYLGECVHFRDLPEILNRGQYLVPRLTKQELRDAVNNPVRTVGKEISASLVNQLISEIGDDMDQLPLLQHSLMRAFLIWKKSGFQAAELNQDHYTEAGGLTSALNKHADEKFNEFKDEKQNYEFQEVSVLEFKAYSLKQRVCMSVFQILTDRATDRKGIRHPTKLQTIYDIIGGLKVGNKEATKEVVNDVINALRIEEAPFLMPPKFVHLHPELMIDIGHESLMRKWDRLAYWTEREAIKANIYRRLDDVRMSNLDPRGTKEKLQSGLLLAVDELLDIHKINYHWAEKYFPEVENIKERHEENISFARKGKIRNRIRDYGIAALIGIALVAAFVVYDQEQRQIEGRAKVELDLANQKLDNDKLQRDREKDSIESMIELRKKDLEKDSLSAQYIFARRDLAITTREGELKEASNKFLREKSALEISKRDTLERQNAKLRLPYEPFFRNANWGPDFRASLVNRLVKLKFSDSKSYQKTLTALNDLTKLQERENNRTPGNTNYWLYSMKEIVDESKSELIDSIALTMARKYAYYTSVQNVGLDVAQNEIYAVSVSERAQAILVNGQLLQKENDKKFHTKGKSYGYTASFVGADSIASISRENIFYSNFEGKQIRKRQIPKSVYKSLYSASSRMISPDGKKLIYLSVKGEYFVLDIRTGVPIHLFTKSSSSYSSSIDKILFSPNSRYCFIKDYYYPVFFDLNKQQEIVPANGTKIMDAVFLGIDDETVLGATVSKVIKSKLPQFSQLDNYLPMDNGGGIQDLAGSQKGDILIVRSTEDYIYKKEKTSWNKYSIPKGQKIVIINDEIYALDIIGDNLLIKEWKTIDVSASNFYSAFNSLMIPRLASIERRVIEPESHSRNLEKRDVQELDSMSREGTLDFSDAELLPIYREAVKSSFVTDQLVQEFERISRQELLPGRKYLSLYEDFKIIVKVPESIVKDSVRRSLNLGRLSFYALFAKDFRGAVEFAKRGLALDPNSQNDWIVTNRALGNLLAGNLDEAHRDYATYKPKNYTNGQRSFREAFLEDINVLTDFGVISPTDKEVQKVIDFLMNRIPSLD